MSDSEAQTITKLITTNVELDNIGYGSQGATLDIGGQSNSDKGVEEFKITAKNGVWLTAAVSQGAGENNHLERIELQTGSNGYFRVGTQKNDPNHVVALVDQDFTKGGLVDVQQVEASNAGSVAINSWVSDAVLSRYDLKDTGLFTTDDTDALIDYNLTSGNDVLNLAIDTDVLEAVDTKVAVKSGDGNDVVTVMASNGLTGDKAVALQVNTAAAGWLVNQQLLDNITIDAGAGNDWVLTPGAGAAIINAGAGNDVVRVDNAGDRGVFVFNNATTDIQKLVTNQDIVSNSDDALSNGANDTAQTYNFFKAQVQVSFKGFESKFVTIDSTNYQTTTKQINQAIKKAVNEDAVLSKLMFAHDNEGNALGLESLIDGLLATNELVIDIIPPVAFDANETAAAKAAREKAGNLMLTTDDLTKADAAYKQATGTLNTGAIDTAVTNAEGLYASEFGTINSAPYTTLPTATNDATAYVAGTNGVVTLTVSAETTGAGTVTVGGRTISLDDLTADVNNTAAEIAAELNLLKTNSPTTTLAFGATNIPLSAITIANALAAVTFTVDANWMGDNSVANLTGLTPVFALGTATGAAVGAGAVVTTPGTATTPESQTITFASPDKDGTITVGGINVAVLATDTAAQVGDKVQAALHEQTIGGQVVSVTDNNAGVVTIKFPAVGGDVAAVTVTQVASTNVTGTASGAESDNVINLGSGQDVLTLGTGALSNDTVQITGYDNGVNTIVNFTAGAVADNNGADLLDFNAYLTSVNATTKAPIAKTVSADNADVVVDNSVTIIEFNDGTALEIADVAVTFDSLTAANVKAMINGTEVGGTHYFGELDLNLTAGAANSTSNYVILVHDNAQVGNENNEGVYKAFHVTSTGTSTDAADVKLIGTFDFGETAAGNSYLDGLVASNLGQGIA
ncbi:beta strand repeat-containing protein [Oceanospirillum multiglobuliferum]|nr:hypothetical protein [Oceanospirillum multiglobuliferum]